ncbi:NAD-dependent epimerase/dehydratase family protein [Phenylobacterium sp.]|uniref:NAD-dependent epimerase/dehydratase family protein n=1 Tax=Phenylobacterium sp. TaxID=1871053 RepID=UPI002731276A|nr:NAD-dependent epimerase/dehydratase family protein [Phenylobacterium sp.]MDP1874112.1 NAD-dependent epimerase/dehydratase family protein [Phenylobacterium sp.]
MSPPVIVTGAAGFIGMHVAERLLARGESVIGVDDFNAYYDPALKAARASRLEASARFRMERLDIAEADAFARLVRESGAVRVVHLAAQAGVRYSIENPFAYERSNLAGHLSVMEACRHQTGFEHLVYASSSSVYGDRPGGGAGFSEDDTAAEPVSLYAATKRACELMSFSYARLYGLPQTGLRFFTVYGPWGRPDMAYFSFTQKILAGEPIEVFGQGQMARDFTYIDDIVDGVIGALDRPPERGANRLLNIGDSAPVGLMEMIAVLEEALGRKAEKVFRPMQPGDVTQTYADISRLRALTGYQPQISLAQGLPRFVRWYRDFYG